MALKGVALRRHGPPDVGSNPKAPGLRRAIGEQRQLH